MYMTFRPSRRCTGPWCANASRFRRAVAHCECSAGLPAGAASAAGAPGDSRAARLSLLTPDRASDLYASLRVTDAGVGLAREHLPRLTERFYRVEGQKSGERAGTGLGLAIVKHIVNRHRGGLAVESVLGEGATFTAYFPLARVEPPSAEPATPLA